MANLKSVIKISSEDYATLKGGGTITKGGVTYSYDADALYIIDETDPPAYAETAGVANTAVADTGGNNIAATYDKKPLVIEVDDTDTSVPSGTYASITAALADGRDVIVKVTITESDDQIEYMRIRTDYSEGSDECKFENNWLNGSIHSNDTFECEWSSAYNHSHGNITYNGTLQPTDVAIANGDKLVITDASSSHRVTRASLTFDGSTTTQALSKKGTWETFKEKTLLYMSVSGTTPSFQDANHNSLTHAQVITLLRDNAKDVVISYNSSLFSCNYDDGVSFYFDSVHPDEQRVECFSLDVAQNNTLIFTSYNDVYLISDTEKSTWNNKADKLKNIVIVKSGTSPNYTYSLPSGTTAASIATDITTKGTTVVLSLDNEIYYYDHTTGSSSSTILHFKYTDTTTDGVVEKDLAIAYANNVVTLTTTEYNEKLLPAVPNNHGNIIFSDLPYLNTGTPLSADFPIADAPANAPFAKCFGYSSFKMYTSDYIPVSPNDTIEGEVWAYRASDATGTAGTLYVGVERFDRDKKPLDNLNGTTYFIANNQTIPTDGVWHKYEGTIVIPTTHTPYNGSDGLGVYYIRLRLYVNYSNGTIPTKIGGLKLTKKNLEATIKYNEIISRGENLVINGSAYMGDNTNFSNYLVFDPLVANGTVGSFTRTGTSQVTQICNYGIPIEQSKKYSFSVDCISANGLSTMYSGLMFYDVDGNEIRENQTKYFEASTTTLAQDLKNGDTTIYLTDASGFDMSQSASANLGLLAWNKVNSYGYHYPVGTFGNVWHNVFAHNAVIDTTNNSIPLRVAWSYGTLSAGTAVSQSHGGASYNYCALVNTVIPTTWTHFKGTPSILPGAAYAKPFFLWNYNKKEDQVWITNLCVTSEASLDAYDTSKELRILSGYTNVNDFAHVGKVITAGSFLRNATNICPGLNNANVVLDIHTAGGNDAYNHQLGFSSSGVYDRQRVAGEFTSWKKLLTGDGTASQFIKGDGSLASNVITTSLKESTSAITYTPTTLPLVNTMSGDKFALLPANQIIVETTTDGGTTWQSAGLTDVQKQALFRAFDNGSYTAAIPKIDGNINKLCGVRITITAMKYNVPDGTAEIDKYSYWNSTYVASGERYVSVCGFYIWINQASNNPIRCKVSAARGDTSDTWVDITDSVYLLGWSGGCYFGTKNNNEKFVFGGNKAQVGNYWNYRFTFFTDGKGGGELVPSTVTQLVSCIKAYGPEIWTYSNNLMLNNHLYTWNYDKNMIVPNGVLPLTDNTQTLGNAGVQWKEIYAYAFKVKNGTSSQFLKANGSVDSTTYTPQTSAGANALLTALPDWTANPTDSVKLIRRDTGGSASFGQITFLTVWNYINGKAATVYAPLASPALTGTPTAPTAASGTNTTQVATTAFVQAAVSGASGGGVQSISCNENDILASTTTTNTTSTAIWTALQAGKMPLLYSGTSGFSIVIQDMGGGYWSGNGVDATNKKSYNVYGYQGSIVSGVATLMAAASDIKAPLIIAVPDEDDTLTSGTYASITTALAAGREVLLKATMSTEDDQDMYLHLLSDETVNDNGYYFYVQRGSNGRSAHIMDDESITYYVTRLATYSELTSMVGDIETLLAAI